MHRCEYIKESDSRVRPGPCLGELSSPPAHFVNYIDVDSADFDVHCFLVWLPASMCVQCCHICIWAPGCDIVLRLGRAASAASG